MRPSATSRSRAPRSSAPAATPLGPLVVQRLEERELRRPLLKVDRHRVLVREAGVAEAPLDREGDVAQRGEREVAERVRADDRADLLDAVAVGDQLLAGRRVDAVEAGP